MSSIRNLTDSEYTVLDVAAPPALPSEAIPSDSPKTLAQPLLTPAEEKKESRMKHVAAPVYAFLTNSLLNLLVLTKMSCPLPLAVIIAAVGASAVSYTQYKYVTEVASSEQKNLGAVSSNLPITYADEFRALVTVLSSLSEGMKFGFAMYLGLEASQFDLHFKLAGAAVAFLFRKTMVTQTEGQKAFFDRGKRFSDTWVGYLAEYTNHIPGIINFNSIVRELTPNLESAGHALAVNAALLGRVSLVPRLLLANFGSSGEWYIEKGFHMRVMGFVQDLANKRESVGLAWLIDNVIRIYNESIGNIVNGRLLNDSLGVVIPPQLVQSLSKMFSFMCIGAVGGVQLPSLFAELYQSLGKTPPSAEIITHVQTAAVPLFILLCGWSAYSQLKASDLRTLPSSSAQDEEKQIGYLLQLQQTYQTPTLESVGLKRVAWEGKHRDIRGSGLVRSISNWMKEISKVGCLIPHPSSASLQAMRTMFCCRRK